MLGRERLRSAPQIAYFPEPFEFHEQIESTETLRIQDPRYRGAGARKLDDLVYVTFGTEAAGMPFFADMIRASIDAATSLDLEVIVGVGHDVDVSQFGPVRDGVRVEQWVDQAEVIPRSRAVVCHAGAGTTLGALSCGVPIVAVPTFADQPWIAERIAATGCGLVEPPGPELDTRMAAAVAQVVGDPPAACADMRARIDELADVTAAVELVEGTAA